MSAALYCRFHLGAGVSIFCARGMVTIANHHSQDVRLGLQAEEAAHWAEWYPVHQARVAIHHAQVGVE